MPSYNKNYNKLIYLTFKDHLFSRIMCMALNLTSDVYVSKPLVNKLISLCLNHETIFSPRFSTKQSRKIVFPATAVTLCPYEFKKYGAFDNCLVSSSEQQWCMEITGNIKAVFNIQNEKKPTRVVFTLRGIFSFFIALAKEPFYNEGDFKFYTVFNFGKVVVMGKYIYIISQGKNLQ